MRTIETNRRTVLGRPGFIGAGAAVGDVEGHAVAEAIREAGFTFKTVGFTIRAGGVVGVCIAVRPVACCCDWFKEGEEEDGKEYYCERYCAA